MTIETTQKKMTAGLGVPFVEMVGLDEDQLFVGDGDDVRDDRAKLIVIYRSQQVVERYYRDDCSTYVILSCASSVLQAAMV